MNNSKFSNKTQLKMGEKFEQIYHQRRNANIKQMKRCSISLDIRVREITTTTRYHMSLRRSELIPSTGELTRHQ